MKKNRGWLPLVEGDVVDIIAPASSSSVEGLHKGLQFLEGWGLVPRMSPQIFGNDVICANTDENRFDQLKEALLTEDSHAIWCVRGGYGANRLVPELAKLRKPKGPPKLFMGFSDITTLHVFLNTQWGWPTVHGPMIDRIGRGLILEPQIKELHDIYFGDEAKVTFSGLKPMNQAARVSKMIRGPVTGGNLMTLQSVIGTAAPWKTRGKVVFLEEIDERGYRVDRLLEHLNQTGHFAGAKAIVLGEFLGGAETDGSNRVPQVLKRFAESLSIPVMTGIQAGHGDLQRPIPFETDAVLTTGPKGTLVIDSGCDLRSDREMEVKKKSKPQLKLRSRA
jgi:muramoyltetrapeptide carboxypeptidase